MYVMLFYKLTMYKRLTFFAHLFYQLRRALSVLWGEPRDPSRSSKSGCVRHTPSKSAVYWSRGSSGIFGVERREREEREERRERESNPSSASLVKFI